MQLFNIFYSVIQTKVKFRLFSSKGLEMVIFRSWGIKIVKTQT